MIILTNFGLRVKNNGEFRYLGITLAFIAKEDEKERLHTPYCKFKKDVKRSASIKKVRFTGTYAGLSQLKNTKERAKSVSKISKFQDDEPETK